MEITVFRPGVDSQCYGDALIDMLKEYAPGVSHADAMRLRAGGSLHDLCEDIYYLILQEGKCLCRHWNGWGRHENAIGNFGNFMTLEQLRGQGIGKKVLEFWHEHLQSLPDKPLGLFCSSKLQHVPMYEHYGFRPAVTGETVYRLFLPLGDSPETFPEFCEMYYTEANRLERRPADFEWRHEIDCLLKFALYARGENPLMPDCPSLESALLYQPGTAQLLFTPEGRCVGWQHNDTVILHPKYRNLDIVDAL